MEKNKDFESAEFPPLEVGDVFTTDVEGEKFECIAIKEDGTPVCRRIK